MAPRLRAGIFGSVFGEASMNVGSKVCTLTSLAILFGPAVPVVATAAQVQDPVPATEEAAAGQEQQPVFRAGVELIELDVSVLDANRRPVRGLTAEDFTVIEDGQPQRVLTVSHVDLADYDPSRSARMRYASRDVSANDLSDQLGDGRLVAIVFDDMNLPSDDAEIVRSARETARAIVDRLGPSDVAAVVYAHNAGRTQDFTNDRTRLLDAIDRFQVSSESVFDPVRTGPPRPIGTDSLQWSPQLARSPCMLGEPAIPALDTVTSRLATAPGRRKTIVFLSVGIGLSLSANDSCGVQLADLTKVILRKAQRANVNIYPIDPAGVGGYQRYLRETMAQRRQERFVEGRRRGPRNPRALADFMEMLADQTGGRAVINTEDFEFAIEQILAEDRDYYLVGYEPRSRAADGRFRKVEVRVNRPNVSVRSRSGYWAPVEGEAFGRRREQGPTATDSALSGLTYVQGVPLRVTAGSIGRAASGNARGADVVAVVSVRYPAIRRAVNDTLTITRNSYGPDGDAGAPSRVVERIALSPSGGVEARHDVLQVLALEPGRHELRFHVQSELLGTSGTVYTDVEVPNLSRTPLALSGLFLAGVDATTTHTGDVGGLLPFVPTTRREFTRNELLTGYLRVHQAGTQARSVTVAIELFDSADQLKHTEQLTFEPDAFATGDGVDIGFEVPLAGLDPGPHLLSVTARLPSGRTARRDVVVGIR
jgi:VWFA-related protein